ncbi:MAG: hypothetical protein IKS54_04935 [Erysipelotrichaceae bacterium]|nr:hypothetical protein [Erysipelotrichaceae bacterium]
MRTEKYLKNVFMYLMIAVFLLSLCSCKKQKKDEKDIKEDETISEDVTKNESEDSQEIVVPEEKTDGSIKYQIDIVDEGEIIFYSSSGYYRYGPSIMKNEDGSYDAWFSSPGNSGSQWDWITYRHSDDGISWNEEEIVLKPTPGSKDQCSVCDPGLIYFGDYYYLGYTGTDYYEGNGSKNSAFVARSKNPDGPYEKWNGNGWGGAPEPIIEYEGDPKGWGIGELSFVIKDDDLFIYYTNVDVSGGYIELCKADLVEDWPNTIRFKDQVLLREHQDSLDVVYDEKNDVFIGFSIFLRMSSGSTLIMYTSPNGKLFEEADRKKDGIEEYAHNMGIAKSKEGWISSDELLLIGYAYGKDWGRWNTRFQQIMITRQ